MVRFLCRFVLVAQMITHRASTATADKAPCDDRRSQIVAYASRPPRQGFVFVDPKPARSKNIEPDVVRVPAEAVAHSLESHVVAEDTPVDHGAEPVVGHRQPVSRRQGLVWVNSELLLEEVVNRVDLDSRLESGIVRPLPYSHPGIPNVASIDVHR